MWVEWVIAGHFPVKARISCKYWKSPLNQQDIDHFNGEFISSNAQIGIIYARIGFNDQAIEKATKLGFHCCRLYGNEPAGLPKSLVFGPVYYFSPDARFKFRGKRRPTNLGTGRIFLLHGLAARRYSNFWPENSTTSSAARTRRQGGVLREKATSVY